MMLGEKQMMEVLILDQGTVQYRSVSPPPLASHWWASPEMHWGVAGLSKEPPRV